MTRTIPTMLAALMLSTATATTASAQAEKTLNRCAKAAAKETRKYVDKYQKAVGGCLEGIAKAVIQNQAKVPPGAAADAAAKCQKSFRKLLNSERPDKTLAASLAAKIGSACDPSVNPAKIQHSAADVLGTGALAEQIEGRNLNRWCESNGGDGSIDDLGEWLECVTSAATCNARQALATEYPRLLEWLQTVKPEILALDPSCGLDCDSCTAADVKDACKALEAVDSSIEGAVDDDRPELTCYGSRSPLDVVFAVEDNGSTNRYCLAQGVASSCHDVSADMRLTDGMALGDLNEDGYLDIVFANRLTPNQTCLSDGAGGFAPCVDVNADANTSWSVALGDLDKDGHLDAVFGNQGVANRVCLGSGTGTFSPCADVNADMNQTSDVEMGDVNGDGALDVILANGLTAAEKNRWCAGDGAGGFTGCADLGDDTYQTRDVALGDLNGDGHLDAVLANLGLPAGTANRRCLGDGTGTFSCASVSSDIDWSNGAALGDVDADGNLDVVFANSTNGGVANRTCLGDGNGDFSPCSDVEPQSEVSTSVALADMDADGDLDAVIANGFVENQLCVNDGAGTFSCLDISPTVLFSSKVAVGQLN